MLKKQKMKHWLYGTLIFLLCAMAYPSAYAASFTVTAQLTGDPREENPDGLIVDVTIDVDGNTALWKIDINSPLHPDGTKLDEFYFNLLGDASIYSFDSFIPTDWVVSTPGTVQGGGAGTSTFLFESTNPNNSNVTNAEGSYLSFLMTKSTGDISQNDLLASEFTGAPFTDLTADIGSYQLGAHLQALDTTVGAVEGVEMSDSGFAVGNYDEIPNLPNVPVPGSMALLASGLVGLVAIRRK